MTFASHVADYALAGWPCILPVPPETKTPPPVGYTGAEGRDTDSLTLVDWVAKFPAHSIALRMPENVIGIDVDQYAKGTGEHTVQKRGAETLAACVERWGPLPATWTSTARGEGPSRIHFFRVPPRRYATKLTGPETGDVEVIQRHHRYAVVWPSVHHSANNGAAAVYRWYDPAGHVVDQVPKPDELAELPAAWVEGLAAGATDQGPAMAAYGAGEALLGQLLDDWRPECADITSARLTALEELGKADAGSRHDTMTGRIHHLVQLAAHGHTGVAAALGELRVIWASLTAGEGREDELERMLLTSARKAVTVVGAVQAVRDPCMLVAGFEGLLAAPAPAPGDPGVTDPELQIVEAPRWASVREIIGTQAFDPNADHDQSLAEAVLARTWPALRYAYDSRGWLLRTPERWELHGDLSDWAVAQLAPLMPVGDLTADKDSDAYGRAKRRARLMAHGGSAAVAKKSKALVSGGTHPVAVALSGLDADPEVLWAGGVPWSLRASLQGPTPAQLDPTTPHLHSAAVAPESVPTPLWDAFLAAVWPDAGVRRWALRVLSIALTGYADRALPILLGETGRGKTQVISLLMSVLGSYAHAGDSRLLGAEGAKAHQSIVFALKGRRLSFIDEGPREGKFAQERLKQLTGGGELTANQMNQNPITFRPTHTLVLTTNDEPVLTDPAVRARTRLIPCQGDPEEVRLTRAAIGHVSSPAWRSEAPGVLAAMLAEAAAWLADPSSAYPTAAPEGIRYLAENIGAEQDPLSSWLEEETEPFEQGTPSGELYQAFRGYCQRSGVRDVPSQTRWGTELTRHGYPALHSRQGKRRPLRLRPHGWVSPLPSGPRDGLAQNGDGLVTGSDPNPSRVKPQVNPQISVNGDGCDGLEGGITHMCAPTCAQEAPTPTTRQPVTPSVGEGPEEVSAESASKPRKTRRAADPAAAAERTEQARQKRLQASAEKRAAAVAEAAGEPVPLPALVTHALVQPISVEDADQLLATITGAGLPLTVDVEHTGYPVGHRDYALRTVQLGGPAFAVVLDAHPEHGADQRDAVRRHLEAATVLHAHSATADLVPLAYDGLADIEDLWAKMHDTVIPALLADPNSTGSDDGGLKKLATAVLGDRAVSETADEARAALFKAGKWLTETEPTTARERSGWAQVDQACATMVRYAGSDVLDTGGLAAALPAVAPDQLERERTTQRMTARVAYHGLRIDGEHTAQLLAAQQAALADAGGRLRAAGVENPGSDMQVAARAAELGASLPRTATGRLSVAKGAIEQYSRHEGPLGDFVRARLDYQKAETALGLFLEPYRLLVEHGDGRARPTVYTLGAKTGRMSCVRPNLQQVPREGGFRACITADPGHLLVSADFAGVELRVAAALSGDPNLIRMLAEDIDLHWVSTRQVFGPDATKADRYQVKRGNFGWLYGGKAPTLSKHMGTSEAVAQQLIDTLGHLLPGVTEWARHTKLGVEAGRTQFPTYSGRIVHMPTKAPHAAPNYCIQGTARELLIDALMRWRQTRWGDCVLLPVHDEVLAMVPEAEAEDATAALVECMQTELYGIPIVAEASEPSFEWKDAA